jgi:hypothetical protein
MDIDYTNLSSMQELHKRGLNLEAYLLDYFPAVFNAGWVGSIVIQYSNEQNGSSDLGIKYVRLLAAYAHFDNNLSGINVKITDIASILQEKYYRNTFGTKPPMVDLEDMEVFFKINQNDKTVSIIPGTYNVVDARLIESS